MNELRSKIISGFKWNLSGQLIIYLSTLAGTIILSRLLSPDQFGLLGMLTVFTSLGNLVIGMGLTHAIVQHRELDDYDLSSIFWLNLFLGLIIGAGFFISAHWIAQFYNQPVLLPVTRWFSLIFIILGCNTVSVGILSKRMDFKSLVVSQLVSNILSYIVAIIMAWQGNGVWSLVAQAIVNQLVYVILNFYFAHWKPQPVFSKNSIQKITRFSRNFLPSQIIDFAALNIDIVLIGKFFGTHELGIFSRSGALVMLPVNSLGVIFNKTFFSVFSALQADHEVLKWNYLRSLKILSVTVLPVLIITAVASHDIVVFLFGEKWLEMSSLVTILAVAAIVVCLNNFNDSLIISQGRTDLLLRINVAEKIILVAGIVIGLPYGLPGLASAKAIASVLTFIPKVFMLTRVMKIPFSEWIRSQYRVLISLGICGATSYGLSMSFETWSILPRLIIVSAGGFSSMMVFLYVARDGIIDELLVLIKTTLKR